jgi:hypothetical protein
MKNSKHSQIDCLIKSIAALVLACGMFMVSGCASIISGTHQDVTITSQPVAANVTVEQLLTTNNVVAWQGQTPANVKLSRNGSYLVTVSMPGYKNAEFPVSNSGMNGWIFGNILIGGLVGIIVDSASGAAKSLEPGTINVNLVSVGDPGDATNSVATPQSVTTTKPVRK